MKGLQKVRDFGQLFLKRWRNAFSTILFYMIQFLLVIFLFGSEYAMVVSGSTTLFQLRRKEPNRLGDYAAALSYAGKSRGAAGHGENGRSREHRLSKSGERGSSLRENDTLCRKLEGHGGGALERMRQLRCLREKGVTYDGPLSDLHRCSGGLQSPTVCILASHWRHPYAGRDWQSGMYIRSGTISAKHFYDLQKAGNYASASQITPIQYF